MVRARERAPERSFERLLRQEVTVPSVDQLPGRCVAQHNAALLVADDEALIGLVDGLDQEGQKRRVPRCRSIRVAFPIQTDSATTGGKYLAEVKKPSFPSSAQTEPFA